MPELIVLALGLAAALSWALQREMRAVAAERAWLARMLPAITNLADRRCAVAGPPVGRDWPQLRAHMARVEAEARRYGLADLTDLAEMLSKRGADDA